MTLVEIVDGPAVGDNVAFETPVAAEKTVEKMIGAGGLTVDGVVGAHDGIGVAFDDSGTEGGSVGVVEIVKRDRNIEAVAKRFGTTVNGVMLGSGNGFEIVRIVALQAGDEGYAEASREERIFTVGFLAASPARITEDIYVGRPESETVIAAEVVVGDGVVVFGASFGGNNVGDGVKEIGVPGGGETDGLREDGGDAGASYAVEAFVPPVVGGNLETRDGGSDVLHLGNFFFDGEAGDEVGDTLVDGERGVEIRRSGGLRLGEREGWEKEQTEAQEFWGSHGCW